MTCQKCGSKTRVTYSRTRHTKPAEGLEYETVTRGRKCLQCGTKFITRERRRDDAQDLLTALEQARMGQKQTEERLQMAAKLLRELISLPCFNGSDDT